MLRKTIIVILIIVVGAFLSSTALAVAGSGANEPAEISSGKKLVVPKPVMPVDGVLTYVGFLVERYQPNPINSNNNNHYTQLVQVNGKSQWFINTEQATGSEFLLEYDKQEVRNTLFSDKATLDGQSISNNISISNSKFKIVVTHLFRLPDGRDLKSDVKNIYITTVPVDTTPPTVPTLTLSTTNWTTSDVTFTISGGTDTGSGIAKYQYSLNGGTWTDGSSGTISTEGQTTVAARAVDNAGNAGTATSTQTAKIDKTLPDISTSPAPGNITEGSNVTITVIDATSGVYNVWYRWDSNTATQVRPYTTPIVITVPVAQGSHILTVTSTDNAGNTKAGQTFTFTIPDTIPPVISITPDSGTYEGDVTVAVTCTDTAGISNSRYVWTETATLEGTEIWKDFTDPTKEDIPQIQERTRYLNIESTDEAGNKATVQKTYTIISKVAVTVKPSLGTMALAGKQGRVVLLNKQGQLLKDTAWGNGSKNIYAVLAYSSGKMLFAGQDGYYQIRDEIGQWKGINLQWRHTGYSIKALAFLNYYDLNRNLIEDVLMAGANGHWQVRNANGILDSARSGKCDIAGVRAVLVRSDNYSFLAGDKGKIAIIKPDVITFHGYNQWSDNTKNIYAMIEGPNKSILFAGQDGKYQIRKPNGQWGVADIWNNGDTRDIKTLSKLPNGKILMTGEDGYYQVININSNNYAITKGEEGQYTLTNQQAAHPREDGRVVIVGNDWHRQYYKYNTACKFEVNKVEKHSITLDTQWDGAGFKNAVVEISEDNSTWIVASDVDWNGDWTRVEVKSLDSGKPYYLRIKASMGYPIYYRTKTVAATTTT